MHGICLVKMNGLSDWSQPTRATYKRRDGKESSINILQSINIIDFVQVLLGYVKGTFLVVFAFKFGILEDWLV